MRAAGTRGTPMGGGPKHCQMEAVMPATADSYLVQREAGSHHGQGTGMRVSGARGSVTRSAPIHGHVEVPTWGNGKPMLLTDKVPKGMQVGTDRRELAYVLPSS
jgi:hypothetical protein